MTFITKVYIPTLQKTSEANIEKKIYKISKIMHSLFVELCKENIKLKVEDIRD